MASRSGETGGLSVARVQVKGCLLMSPDKTGQDPKVRHLDPRRGCNMEAFETPSLLRITTAPSPTHLISGWTLGGNLTEYINDYPGPEVDRLRLVGAPPAPGSLRVYQLQVIRHRQ